MRDTGKIKPEFTSRGVFVPWPGLLSLFAALLIVALIPLWMFTVKAIYVADNVETMREEGKARDVILIKHGEDIAGLKAKGQP